MNTVLCDSVDISDSLLYPCVIRLLTFPSGVNNLKWISIDFENTKNVIVASSMLVLGLGGAAISVVTNNINLSISGMSLAAIIGILLNLLIKEEK